METTDRLVVLGHRTFTLQYVDLYRGLVIDSCCEDFGLLGRDGRVGLDQLGHDTTHGLDTQ